jgi:two-component system sensor histidine kinase MtrB
VIALFALGGLALSLLLALITYTLADRYLVAQRERSARRQTYLNARVLRQDLLTPGADVTTALAGLELPTNSSVVFRQGEKWFASSIAAGRTSIPPPLRASVRRGNAAQQRIELDGEPTLVVGVPIPTVEGEYFEVFRLEELDNTLGVIRQALVGAAAATTVLAALLGVWAGRRVLQPLAEVGSAAAEIAEGDLSRRLEDSGDPDLAELTDSFNRMVDALQARIERDARFASSVSHELRSPLTTLAAASELVANLRDELPPRSRDAIDVLRSDVDRFQRLVEELLELSRAEAQVDDLVPEPVRLGELLLHMTTSTPGRSFTIEIDPDVSETAILTEKRRLERILANLLENARSHGEGIERVTIGRVDDRVRIAIEDRGPGVAAAERQRIFERFYRGAAAGRRNAAAGTGLGLALVAEHARALGAVVFIEDGRGGARFVVELPWRPA